ncbi:MAG: hypothetical protein GX458_15290 [Phyllobacteriaceae bacterium]|nr:hypothetical protein [Phyllobacteriaceae bacterium]
MTSRDAVRILHAASGAVGLATIVVFMATTITVEILADPATIATAKRGIAWGLCLLLPALVTAGLTGMRLSGGAEAGIAGRKMARMRIVAPNGVLVLVPAALFLAGRAAAGAFDGVFYAVQAVELIAGTVNVVLLSLNFRDGLAMAAKRRR